MRACALMVCLLWTGWASAQPVWTQPGQQSYARSSAAELATAARLALEDPYRAYRTGALRSLVESLQRDPHAAPLAAPADSLHTALVYARDHRDYHLQLALCVVLYAQRRTGDSAAACQAAGDAAALAFERLGDHALGRTIAQLESHRCAGARAVLERIEAFVEHDMAVAALLKRPFHGLDERQKRAYARSLAQALRAHPKTSLAPDGYRRVGEVYYHLRRWRAMKRAYGRVLRRDPAAAGATPIGYHIDRANRALRRQGIIAAAVLALAGALAALALHALRRPIVFRPGFLCRRLAWYGGVYLLLALAVFGLDAALSARSLIGAAATFVPPIQEPLVPFGMLECSAWRLTVPALLVGCVSLVAAIAYLSFGAAPSRLAAALIALVSGAAAWTLFVVVTAYDGFLTPRTVVSRSHILYSGELEDLLVQNPARVLRANPALRHSTNTDLKLFIADHFPDGLPGDRHTP